MVFSVFGKKNDQTNGDKKGENANMPPFSPPLILKT